MAELSNQTYCYFCKREFRAGEGRYRFFQEEKEVECCPSCFDEIRAIPPQPLGEQTGKRRTCKREKEYSGTNGK
jgi:hypothetical protein